MDDQLDFVDHEGGDGGHQGVQARSPGQETIQLYQSRVHSSVHDVNLEHIYS